MQTRTIQFGVLLFLFLSLFVVQIYLFRYQPYPLFKSIIMVLNSIVMILYAKAINNNLHEK
jgi:hypothetical protein